ncbi:alpha/beta hydrolase [Mesobaculum littorinae]|uniref:Alpha/beta hydrolase n=1 Tax=Mesobaculum littorinae TaxID=2486419 RepID=A0A438AMH3_9RHOB|nr:alpha/beta hydrolase [Mesobaculum littorinae]RVV99882.1 alpha/beta hydrolase [Mesobaculum littorinae]
MQTYAFALLVLVAGLSGCGLIVDQRADRREAEAEAAYPPEGEFVIVGDRRVHYVQAGTGPDLVLIHGASGSTRDFTFDFLGRVQDDYRVTIFDRPGLGYTDRAADFYGGAFDERAESPQVQADLLKAAADRLGVQHPIVLGQSYGGAVAMAWGLDHDPAALVIVSGATQPWDGSLSATYQTTASSLGGAGLVPLITAFATQGQIHSALEGIFAPQDIPEGYEEYIGAPLSIRRETFRASSRQVNTLKPHLKEMAPRYPQLDIPVEILHGTADSIVPYEVHALPLSRQLPDANLTLIENGGHMIHHVAAEQVVEAIDRVAKRAGLR